MLPVTPDIGIRLRPVQNKNVVVVVTNHITEVSNRIDFAVSGCLMTPRHHQARGRRPLRR
jgi:hypothetical protein